MTGQDDFAWGSQSQGASGFDNDFEITAEELRGVEYTPVAQRTQYQPYGGVQQVAVQGSPAGGINFSTVFKKGILWALIGGLVGFILQEVFDAATSSDAILARMGYDSLYDLNYFNEDMALDIIKRAVRISSALFSMLIAVGLGLFMGIGEGMYYGSKENAKKYALIGAGLSLAIGFISGYIAQALYSSIIGDASSEIAEAFVRGIGWSIMGLGIGIAIGLIRAEKKRIIYCALGGLAGGFVGGFLFNFIVAAFSTGEDDTGVVGRAIGILIMGALIGLGIGLLEQIAKQAWLKVVRGEFEGKEYLVFSGTTSIGNNSKNTIVLFKDKLVSPHHCDIIQDGGRFVLVDRGSPMGTIVNGMRVTQKVLKQGDTIAIGNSVLIFNAK